MKYIAILILALNLSGCMYQSVSDHDIQRAINKCNETNEKVERITSDFSGREGVHCSPSGKFHWLQ